MDEKTLIQYRCVDDENYKIRKSLAIIVTAAGAILTLLGFILAPLGSYNGALQCVCYGMTILIFMPLILIVLLSNGKTSITVTSHRVYGRSGKDEVNLPLDAITSARKNGRKWLAFSSPSANVSFKFYTPEKMEKVWQVVNQQLVKRQQNKESIEGADESVDVEKLKKYKELMDAGILTQEEFDAKKKKILGL